ncbi:hypothetical protein AHF37_03857 [Paragonimus kellicotti]|nr:hypothetical protein AHF37_03857 [Paragonimus kellicotti]
MSRIQRPLSTSSELLVIKRTLTSSPTSRSNRSNNEPIVEHSTILRFTFAIAVSCDSLLIVDSPKKSALKKTAKRDVVVKDAPQVTPCYFHLEYTADTRDYLLATDVVVFTLSLAKVYPAGLTSKAVSPWIDGNTLWIAWEEQVHLECSDENIMDIWRRSNNGGARISIWDNKENCSVQTRFDRPRSITPNSSCDARGVETAVRSVVKFCDKDVDISPDENYNKIVYEESKKKAEEDQETLSNPITSKRTCVKDRESYNNVNSFKSDRSVGSTKSVCVQTHASANLTARISSTRYAPHPFSTPASSHPTFPFFVAPLPAPSRGPGGHAVVVGVLPAMVVRLTALLVISTVCLCAPPRSASQSGPAVDLVLQQILGLFPPYHHTILPTPPLSRKSRSYYLPGILLSRLFTSIV